MAEYNRKYLIVGPWPRHRKMVRDVIKENTNLKISPRKLRPVQLAHSDNQVAIGSISTVFNDARISVENGERDIQHLRKYNIQLIYVSSSKSRESHLIIEAQTNEYKDVIAIRLPEVLFERDGIGMKSQISRLLKEHWL